MSKWTHITACLSMDTCLEEPKNKIKTIVKKVLAEGPQITGSEGNAEFFVNVPRGYNTWTSEYNNEKQCIVEHQFQSQVVITVQGDLRDREKPQTEAEFVAFMEYITKKFILRDCSMNIGDD